MDTGETSPKRRTRARRSAPRASGESSDQDVNGVQASPEDDRSAECDAAAANGIGKKNILLIGPTGSYKSSTANQLVGIENPSKDCVAGGATPRLPFPVMSYNDEDGSSVTNECAGADSENPGYRRTPFYVIDTPGFGNTEGATLKQMVERDKLTALKIIGFIDVQEVSVDAVAFFLANPILTRADPHLQQVLRSFLARFNEPEQMIHRMIVVQAFIENDDVNAKTRVAARSRKIFRSMVESVVRDAGIPCHLPDEFPYAAICPFADEGGSVEKTVGAFSKAVHQAEHNAARFSDTPAPFRPRLPKGKCRRCSYDERDGADLADPKSAKLCHPSFKTQEKWSFLKPLKSTSGSLPLRVFDCLRKVLVAVVTGVPTGASFVAHHGFQLFDEKDWICEKCGRVAQTEGCTEMPHLLER